MNMRLKIIIIILVVGTSLAFTLTQSNPQKNPQLIKLRIGDYQKYLKSYPPLDRLYAKGNSAYFLVNDEEMQNINRTGLPFTLHQVVPRSTHRLTSPSGDVNGPFHNYRETGTELKQLADKFPDLAQLTSMGQSVEGRDLHIIKISDSVQTDENEPNIYIIGCHHAREWISVEVPLLFARHLLHEYATNPQVQKAVNGAQIYIIPLLNPDGLEFSIHYYRWWRKNRRYNRNYSYGVDLNRNYGYQWGYDDEGSSPSIFSYVYRGSAPFSEPETSSLRDFMLTHPPAGSISYHNYSQLIMYPWSYTREPAPDNKKMEEMVRQMSLRMREVNGRIYTYGSGATSLYLVNGDTDDWVYGTFRVPAFTIELPPDEYIKGGFFNPDTDIEGIFAENLPALIYFINYFVDNPANQPQKDKMPVLRTRPKPVKPLKK